MKCSFSVLMLITPIALSACASNESRVSMDVTRGRDECPEGYYKQRMGPGKLCTLSAREKPKFTNPKQVNGQCPINYTPFLGGCVETYLMNGMTNAMSNYKKMLKDMGYFDPRCPPDFVAVGNWCKSTNSTSKQVVPMNF
jgi:hypothetical protein